MQCAVTAAALCVLYGGVLQRMSHVAGRFIAAQSDKSSQVPDWHHQTNMADMNQVPGSNTGRQHSLWPTTAHVLLLLLLPTAGSQGQCDSVPAF